MKSQIHFKAAFLSLGLALLGNASVRAQQMDHSNMPGMNMPRANTTGNAGEGGRAPAAVTSPQTGDAAKGASNAARSSSSPQNPSDSISNSPAAGSGMQPRAARPDRN